MSRIVLVFLLSMIIGLCENDTLAAGANGHVRVRAKDVNAYKNSLMGRSLSSKATGSEKSVSSLKRLKRISKANFNYDKYPNAFWKIGGLLLQAGIVVAGLTSSFVVSVSYGFTSIWLLIILVGLALMLLSLPFLLIGYILGSKKPSEPDDFY